MKAINNILSIILFIGSFFPVSAQYTLPAVCPGQETATYAVAGQPGSHYLWELPADARIISRSAMDDTVIVDYSNVSPGNYNISVTEVLAFGCEGSPYSTTVQVIAEGKIFNANQVEFCQGDVYTLDPGQYSTYRWNNGTFDRTINITQSGWVKLTVNEDQVCSITDSIYAVANPLPQPDIKYYDPNYAQINDTAELTSLKICGSSSKVLYVDESTNYDFAEWALNEFSNSVGIGSELTVDYSFQSDQVILIVTDQNGCINTDTITIVGCDLDEIKDRIPNAFNPQEEKWQIPEIKEFYGARLEIFDRWGRLVFSTDNMYGSNGQWDGKYKGQLLPADAYYYVVNYNTNEIAESIAGEINLIY